MKILIVEDMKHWQDKIADALEYLGHKVVGVKKNSMSAIDFLQVRAVDLVFIDIHLENEPKGGLKVIEFLHKKAVSDEYNLSQKFEVIPFVLISSINDYTIWEEAQKFEHPLHPFPKGGVEVKEDLHKPLAYQVAINQALRLVPLYESIKTEGKYLQLRPVAEKGEDEKLKPKITHKVHQKDILWIESKGKYAFVNLKASKGRPSVIRLREAFKEFKPNGCYYYSDLVEIQKSFIVNKDNIKDRVNDCLIFGDENAGVDRPRPSEGVQVRLRKGFDASLLD